MNLIISCKHPETFTPDNKRVIIRSFIPSDETRVAHIIGRALALNEIEVEEELKNVHAEFDSRHYDINVSLMLHYAKVQKYIFTHRALSHARQLLIGALFSGEYALESAALFNPSIVPHPDQSELEEGELRVIMSLRATGEGHISSIEFRVGIISVKGNINFSPHSPFVTVPQILPNPSYKKRRFITKLHEMGFNNDCSQAVMSELKDTFERSELKKSMHHVKCESIPITHAYQRTFECMLWLADSNYEVQFSPKLAVSERIIFPVSANESNGIEDARFVHLTEDDGSSMYYATYTAYSGKAVLPQLIETQDFLHFRILTLNGTAVQNKGMALFPRRVNGRYAMLSRQDDENIYIMFSDNPHHWSDPEILIRPAYSWESVKIGNCGSPIETHAGWLVITHGVGPMRKYCIGAALLDLEDPTKVIGRLRVPLISPEGLEREGYVPNVVYSCGALLHNGIVFLPYALSDTATSIVSFSLEEILKAFFEKSE